MNFANLYRTKMEEHKKFVREMPVSNLNYYAGLLAQTHRFVFHTTRLLSLAASNTALNDMKLRHEFLDHATLEKGHSNLLIKDLKALGFKPDDFPELESTASLYQSQYYWIQFVSTESFMGYALALEGMAVNGGDTLVKMVEEYHSPKAANFYRVHVNEDPEHTEHGLEMVSKFPAEIQKQVALNFIHTFDRHVKMRIELAKISEAQQSSDLKTAA